MGVPDNGLAEGIVWILKNCSRVKTYDLVLIGWFTAMAVCARTVSTLVALSWEPFSKSKCCYGNEGGKNLKMKLYVVVCYGMIFLSCRSFVPFTL